MTFMHLFFHIYESIKSIIDVFFWFFFVGLFIIHLKYALFSVFPFVFSLKYSIFAVRNAMGVPISRYIPCVYCCLYFVSGI